MSDKSLDIESYITILFSKFKLTVFAKMFTLKKIEHRCTNQVNEPKLVSGNTNFRKLDSFFKQSIKIPEEM